MKQQLKDHKVYQSQTKNALEKKPSELSTPYSQPRGFLSFDWHLKLTFFLCGLLINFFFVLYLYTYVCKRLSMMNDIDNKLGEDRYTYNWEKHVGNGDVWFLGKLLGFRLWAKTKPTSSRKIMLLFLCLYLFDNIIFSMLLPMFFCEKKRMEPNSRKKRRIPGRNTLALHLPG